MSTTVVSAQLRRQVDQWAKTWLTAKFSRVLELRAQDPGPFIPSPCSRSGAARPSTSTFTTALGAASLRMISSFATRMTLTGFGRFDLAYFRHTDRWFTSTVD